MHKWKLQFLMVLSCPTVWPQLRHEAFRAPSTIYVGYIHPDFSATWRLHTKDEEATRFLSHIHQENYKLLVFCVKSRPYLYSSSSPSRDLCIRMTYQIYLFFILMALLERRLFPLSALTALFAGECARRRIIGQQRSGPQLRHNLSSVTKSLSWRSWGWWKLFLS